MRRIAFPLLALISLGLISLVSAATAATRPRYGGTLRVAMQSAPMTLDMPALSTPIDYWDMARVLSLVGDNLVRVDAEGRPQPALALSWQSDSTARHWQFTLHHGAKFHDGTPASAATLAHILAALHPDWNVRAGTSTTDSLTIDTETASPSFLAELALPRNLVLTHNASGLPVGTGPFRIAEFQPGRVLKLAANEECWSGRPFLDAIEIEFGKSLRDQGVALELGRADVIEAAPQAANASSRIRTVSSLPVELMALVFASNSKAQDVRLRQALALSIDRKPIQSVLLKGAAEPTNSILPNWMTGYSAAFPTQANVQRAKVLLADSHPPTLTLDYDPRDPQAQLIAERIALNAREAGITVQVSLSGPDDLRLVRIALPSPDTALALRETARQLSLSPPGLHDNTVEDFFQAEHALLDDDSVIPLFHLPITSAASARVRGWAPDQLGGWNLADLSLVEARLDDSRLEAPR
jgi:peptide/nickel transport system substrate-binding protein